MLIKVYDTMLELLMEKAKASNLDENEVEKYFVPEGIIQGQSYYERLASSLQNGTSSGMDKSIKFNGENHDIIKRVLFDFDYEKVLKEYNSGWEDLYKRILEMGIVDVGAQKREERTQKEKDPAKKAKKEKQATNWEKYCKGLYEGAEFLRDGGEEKLDGFIAHSDQSSFDEKWFDDIKGIKIHGVGMALACDWLKECGCTWLAKPDVHIIKVYSAMRGVDSDKAKPQDAVKYFFEWAVELKSKGYTDVTAYKLDKIVWLICTGDFYLHKDSTIGRDKLVNEINDIKGSVNCG